MLASTVRYFMNVGRCVDEISPGEKQEHEARNGGKDEGSRRGGGGGGGGRFQWCPTCSVLTSVAGASVIDLRAICNVEHIQIQTCYSTLMCKEADKVLLISKSDNFCKVILLCLLIESESKNLSNFILTWPHIYIPSPVPRKLSAFLKSST